MKKKTAKPAPLICWDIYSQKLHRVLYPGKLPIGGFQKQSLIDYPGHITSVIFTQGCNFRCDYCHNPELVIPEKIKKSTSHNSTLILDWIRNNHKLLDAVCITGGEPTLHSTLPEFISQIKNMGLKVKLDTNGTNPEVLDQLISGEMVDYIAMDIKAPLNFDKYKQIVNGNFNEKLFSNVASSVKLLNKSQTEHEFRTTLDKSLNTYDLEEIASSIFGDYFLQKVRYDKNIIGQNGINENVDINKLLKIKRKDISIHLR